MFPVWRDVKGWTEWDTGRIPSHWYVRAIRVTLSHHPSHVKRTCDQSSFFNHLSLLRLLLSSVSPVVTSPASPSLLLNPSNPTRLRSRRHHRQPITNPPPMAVDEQSPQIPDSIIRHQTTRANPLLARAPTPPPPPLHQSKPTPMNPRL
jgi:hypothetical protein